MKEPLSILHCMLNPMTGPWSLMKRLAEAQSKTGRYKEVALGIITDSSWPSAYQEQLLDLPVRVFQHRILRIPGTGQHLLQLIGKHPLNDWLTILGKNAEGGSIVVHFHNGWASGAFLPISIEGLKITSVATFHGIAGAHDLRKQPLRRFLHRFFARRLLRYNSHLTAVDQGCLPTAKELFGLSGDLFDIIPNGVPEGLTLECPYASGGKCLTIAHIGLLYEDKGWEIIAAAVIDLYRSGRKIQMIIAGTGPGESQAQRLAVEYPDCITFLGHVSDPCRDVLPKVDLLGLMTQNDGLPMAIIEALSYGVPVISTAIGGIPDAVCDGESGYIIPRSQEALRSLLDRLYRQPEELKRLSNGAILAFRERFEIGNIVDSYERVYRKG